MTGTFCSQVDKRDIEATEDLLDAYFMQVVLSITCACVDNFLSCQQSGTTWSIIVARWYASHHYNLRWTVTSATMQVDHTLSRLNVLKERIESIEALVTIDLDHRRNELVAFDLVMPMLQVWRCKGIWTMQCKAGLMASPS